MKSDRFSAPVISAMLAPTAFAAQWTRNSSLEDERGGGDYTIIDCDDTDDESNEDSGDDGEQPDWFLRGAADALPPAASIGIKLNLDASVRAADREKIRIAKADTQGVLQNVFDALESGIVTHVKVNGSFPWDMGTVKKINPKMDLRSVQDSLKPTRDDGVVMGTT